MNLPLPELIQLIINGLITGSVITLGAVGLSLVMSTLDIGSFAAGDYLTYGAFAAFWVNIMLGQNIVVALIGSALLVALLSVALDKVLLLRFIDKGANSLLIVTLGLALGMRSVLYLVFGTSPRRLGIDVEQVFDLGIIRISAPQLITIVIAGVSILVLALLLARTAIGKSMRALADDRDLASIAGINVDRLRVYIWASAGLFTGVAGTMQAMLQASFDPAMGWNSLFLLFTAVILGGVGSIYGTLAGGFLLGIGMELSTWSGLPNGGFGSEFKPLIAFVVLLAVLLARPQGLFGRTRLL